MGVPSAGTIYKQAIWGRGVANRMREVMWLIDTGLGLGNTQNWPPPSALCVSCSFSHEAILRGLVFGGCIFFLIASHLLSVEFLLNRKCCLASLLTFSTQKKDSHIFQAGGNPKWSLIAPDNVVQVTCCIPSCDVAFFWGKTLSFVKISFLVTQFLLEHI